MSVHYKFKSVLNFDTITFDGLHISVADLKKAIISQKRLGKITDFDLQITNAQTKEEYVEDTTLIPKNTSVYLTRIPLAQQTKKSWEAPPEKPSQTRNRFKQDSGVSLDISKMKGSEEEKIREMMLQSTADYDPKSYQRTKGHYQTGEVPATYRCNKCKKGGHWIKNCPLGSSKEHTEVKRTTGIPRSFRDKDPLLEQEKMEPLPIVETKTTIPEDLICSICNDLFTDAVMIPCCGSSFCDDCVRTALLESEDNECPDCGEKGSSPGALIPNRFIRNSVNSFKNETGYTATALKKAEGNIPNKKPVSKEENVEEVEEEPIISEIEKEEPNAEEPEKSADVKEKQELQEIVANDKIEERKEEAEQEQEASSEKTSVNATSAPKDEPQTHTEVESDFEDNIVVTVPPAQVESQHAVFRDRPSYNDRRIQHVKPLELEAPSQKISKISPMNVNNNDNSNYGSSLPMRNVDWGLERNKYEQHQHQHGYKELNKEVGPNKIGCISTTYPNQSVKPVHMMPSYPFCDPGQRPLRPLGGMHDMMPDGGMNRPNIYQPPNRMLQGPPIQGPPPMGQFQNHYGPILSRPNVGYNQFMPPDVRADCAGYGPPPRHMPSDHPSMGMMPSSRNLASVYQGVAEKVGTGIIDDPLEVFNRIMKEKEKRKEVRCRSPERHHSRSDHHQQRNRFRTSPYDYDKRKERDRERERSAEREREQRRRDFSGRGLDRKADKIYPRRRRSNSFSDKSTRSRSRSNTPGKRRSMSPHKRRSRSYKRPSDEKYHHRNEKQRHEHHRLPGARHTKESPPPPLPPPHCATSSQLLQRTLDKAPHHHEFYDAAVEYEQPPPPGYEITLTGPLHERTPTRPLRHHQRHERSPSKGQERNRLHSPPRSVTPKSLPAAKHEKREVDEKRHDCGRSSKRRESSRSKERPTHHSSKAEEEAVAEKRRTDDRRLSNNGGSPEVEQPKTAPAADEVPKSKGSAARSEEDWKLNDSDRMSVDSRKEEKHHESKRDRKFKERKKRRKEKTQRKKSKKEKRDKSKGAGEYKKEKSSSSRDGHQTPTTGGATTPKVDHKHETAQLPAEGNEPLVAVAANGEASKATPPPEIIAENRASSNSNSEDDDNGNKCRQRASREPYERIDEPALSKWERDEAATNAPVSTMPSAIRSGSSSRDDEGTAQPSRHPSDERKAITSEVLRKAEHVIFAKAENVIRPLELKKSTHAVERPKVVGNIGIGGGTFENIQIVVPLVEEPKRRRSRSNEVAMATGHATIKDRLGSKIVTNNNNNAFSSLKRTATNATTSSASQGAQFNKQRRSSLIVPAEEEHGGEKRERIEEPAKHRNMFREAREFRDRDRVERERGGGRHDLKSVGIVQQNNGGGGRRNHRNAFASPPRGGDDRRTPRTRDDVARDDRRGSANNNSGRGILDEKIKENKSYGSHGHNVKKESGKRGGGDEERMKYERYRQRDRERNIDELHNKQRGEHSKRNEGERSSHGRAEARRHTSATVPVRGAGAGGSSSAATSDSDSEAAKSNDHSKRKKKHKSKKDKKRSKRSSSAESCVAAGSVSGLKQLRNKKKIKSSNRKNKKNKK